MHKPALISPTISFSTSTWDLETRWIKARKVYFPEELELLLEALDFDSLEGLESEVLDSLDSLESLAPLLDEESLESEEVALDVAELFFP